MIAADVICGGNERHRLEPMITAACEELARAGIGETPQIALADAGYWNSPHIEQLADRGIQAIIEPVFAHTKIIRSADRFQRRGLHACKAEWRLLTATHNLLKLWRRSMSPQPA